MHITLEADYAVRIVHCLAQMCIRDSSTNSTKSVAFFFVGKGTVSANAKTGGGVSYGKVRKW